VCLRAGGRRYLLLHPGDVVRGHAAHLLLRQPQHLWIHHLGGGGAAGEIEIGAGGWELVRWFFWLLRLVFFPPFSLSSSLINAGQVLNLIYWQTKRAVIIRKNKTDSNCVSVSPSLKGEAGRIGHLGSALTAERDNVTVKWAFTWQWTGSSVHFSPLSKRVRTRAGSLGNSSCPLSISIRSPVQKQVAFFLIAQLHFCYCCKIRF
jgi:hypothetical protein